jgi:hypothetical protein
MDEHSWLIENALWVITYYTNYYDSLRKTFSETTDVEKYTFVHRLDCELFCARFEVEVV